MVCVLSVVSALPPLPHGSRLALTTPGWGRGVGTGGAVWPASELLCRWMLDEGMAVQGASVLELGSGTGAVGLFAAGCGASRVLLTDGDASLCSLAAENARDNRALMPDASVTTRRYRWGGSIEALGGPFDLALASDLTYEPAAHGAPVVYALARGDLLATRALATVGPNGSWGVCTTAGASPSCPESIGCSSRFGPPERLLRPPAQPRPALHTLGALIHTIGLLLEAPAPPRVLLAHTHRPLTSVLKGSGCMDHLFAAAERRGVRACELYATRAGMAFVSLIEMSLDEPRVY